MNRLNIVASLFTILLSTSVLSAEAMNAIAQQAQSSQADHYLSLAERSTKSNKTPLGIQPKDAYYVAAAQFSLEDCINDTTRQCLQLIHALEKGLGVKQSEYLARKWQDNLSASEAVKQSLYQQTLTWFNSARIQRVPLPKIKLGQCHSVEWQRTLVETESVFICRRTAKQLAALSLTTAPKSLLSPREVAKQMGDSERANEFIAMAPFIENKIGRSIKAEWFVLSGLEPRFGCLITTDFEKNIAFKNPCHGDEWNSLGLPLTSNASQWQPTETQPLHIPHYSVDGEEIVLGTLPNNKTVNYQNLKPEPLSIQKKSPAVQMAIAARWQQLPLLESLLEENSYNSMKAEPKRAEILIQAIGTQYLPLIQLLLQKGFQLDEKLKHGGSANEVVKILNNPAINDLIKRHHTDR